MTISGHSKHRSQAIADCEPSMASGTYGKCECVECQETYGHGQGVGLDRRSQPFYGNSYKACAGWPGRWHPHSVRTSSMAGCDGPVDALWHRSPGSICHAIKQPFAGAPSLAHDSRGAHRAMSGSWRLAYNLKSFAKAPCKPRRRSYAFGPCSVSLGHPRRRIHSRLRSVEHAGRVSGLLARAVGATVSRMLWNRRREEVSHDTAGGRPRLSMLSRNDALMALNATYTRARLVCNV